MPGIGTLRELCASTRYLHPKPEADEGHVRRSIPRHHGDMSVSRPPIAERLAGTHQPE